jgi:hypothetical protein
MQSWERYTIILLMLVIVAVGLMGCSPPPDIDRAVIEGRDTQQDTLEPNHTETIGNMEAIGSALGCVFAPQTCQKNK